MASATKITSWSFSRWGVYDQCPLKARLKFIDKLPEPGSDAMDRGTAVHKSIEGYLTGTVKRLAVEHNPKAFGDLYKQIKARRKRDPDSVSIEDTWAFRADWTETVYNDWNGCWLRVKVDVATLDGDYDNVIVNICDWKTGKFRSSDQSNYALQLDLYALSALMKFKDAETVSVLPSLIYIDHGIRHAVGTYSKDDLPRLKTEWEKRVKPMLSDTTFAPKPNAFCKWCAYRKDAGGPCKF